MTDTLVYVYGHYDSRGGTTAIAAESREAADNVYNEELFAWSETGSQLVGDNRAAAQAVTEMLNPDHESPASQDFLYAAVLQNDPGEDNELEGDSICGLQGEVWITVPPLAVSGDVATIERMLRFVPIERFEGEMHEVSCGVVRKGQDIWLEDGYTKPCGYNDNYLLLFRMEPRRMIRVELDGETYEYEEEQDDRPGNWEHPRWDDDAYSFVLMHR